MVRHEKKPANHIWACGLTYMMLERGLETEAEAVNIVIEHTTETEDDHTCEADGQGNASVGITLESGNRILIGVDVHGLHDQQVVVERDNRIGQGDEHQERIASVECCHEHEELREETSEGRNTSQREEAERHEERELGV